MESDDEVYSIYFFPTQSFFFLLSHNMQSIPFCLCVCVWYKIFLITATNYSLFYWNSPIYPVRQLQLDSHFIDGYSFFNSILSVKMYPHLVIHYHFPIHNTHTLFIVHCTWNSLLISSISVFYCDFEYEQIYTPFIFNHFHQHHCDVFFSSIVVSDMFFLPLSCTRMSFSNQHDIVFCIW